MLIPTLSDSLAGRMGILHLHPMAQAELEGRDSRFLRRLFKGEFPTRQVEGLGRALAERVVAGGHPAALSRATQRRQAAWLRDYVESPVQRDARDSRA